MNAALANEAIKKKPRVSVSDIEAGILEMIRNGELQPGTPLREVEMCERFGVSRTPVREALRLLQNKGFVEYVPNCGVQVAEITEEELNNITSIRLVLETLVSRQAAEKITDEQIRELQQLNNDFLESSETKAAQLDYRFHSRIGQISGNKMAVRFLSDLNDRYSAFGPEMRMRTERIKVSYHEHDAIIRALASHDSEMAAMQATFHFQMSRKTQLEKLDAYIRAYHK